MSKLLPLHFLVTTNQLSDLFNGSTELCSAFFREILVRSKNALVLGYAERVLVDQNSKARSPCFGYFHLMFCGTK